MVLVVHAAFIFFPRRNFERPLIWGYVQIHSLRSYIEEYKRVKDPSLTGAPAKTQGQGDGLWTIPHTARCRSLMTSTRSSGNPAWLS